MSADFNRPFTFDRVVRILIGIATIAVLVFVLNFFSSVLIPFFIAWVIAYMLHPLVCMVQKHLKIKNRGAAIAVTLITVLAVLTGLVFLLANPVSTEIKHLFVLFDTYSHTNWNLKYLPTEWEGAIKELIGMSDVKDLFSWETTMKLVNKAWPQLTKLLSGGLNVILSLFIVFIVMLYVVFILKDYDAMQHGWKNVIPVKYRPFIVRLWNDVELAMNRYFRGQSLVALIVGILFSIGFLIIKLPLAIVLGMLLGVLNLVPYLQTVGIIPITLMALLKSLDTNENFWMIMLGVGIVFAIVQGFQDTFLVPKIMGKITGMNPAYILLSLSIWGYLLGIIGMIVALPFTVIIISYYKQFVLHSKVDEDLEVPHSPQEL